MLYPTVDRDCLTQVLVASGGDIHAASASLKTMGFNSELGDSLGDFLRSMDSNHDLQAALALSLQNASDFVSGSAARHSSRGSADVAEFQSLRDIARQHSEGGLSLRAIEAATFRFRQPPAAGPASDANSELDADDDSTAAGSSSSRTCPVCILAMLGGEEFRRLPCLHVFHVRCIDDWLGRSRLCPVCKKDVAAAAVARV